MRRASEALEDGIAALADVVGTYALVHDLRGETARFRGATHRTNANSAAKTAQTTQFAVTANVCHPAEVVSYSMISTGIIANVAINTSGSN